VTHNSANIMIGRKQNEEESPSGLHNALSTGTVVTGNISTETDFRLDGKVEGDITCKGKIVIGPKGEVKGNIEADNAEILGTVEGNIFVRARLSLKATANVKGDIQVQILEVEPNAMFNGICKMDRQVPEQNR
jgi:cytoskeletal protein CcmA (bactofilin family)